MTLLGIDLGGTKIAFALFSSDGTLMARETVAVGGRGGADVGALITERARALVASQPVIAVSAVGVAVPGIYRAGSGTVWAPNIPGWDDYPMLEELRAAFGTRTAITVENDRAAYIAGEAWRGAARGSRNAIYLAVGTGIGAGLLVDGRVLHGHGDIAGAIGWLGLDRPYRAEYIECGQFEHHASGPGLVKCVGALLAAGPSASSALRRRDSLTASDVIAAADTGDSVAQRVVDDAVAYWGMAAATLVSLFNPEVIIFGGGVFGPALPLLPRIRSEAARWAQPIAMQQVTFVPSVLGNDAGVYGAARLAMQSAAAAPLLERTPV